MFINVSHAPEVPAPPLATDEEIREAIDNADATKYRLPMSMGPELRRDKDKGMTSPWISVTTVCGRTTLFFVPVL